RNAFLRWAKRVGIRWPIKRSDVNGRLYHPIDDDSLKSLECRHPFIAELRQARKTLKSLSNQRLLIDWPTSRHYFSTIPFRSVTGRNQPRHFVFGCPKWMRWLVLPPSADHVLVYVDFSAQEIGIAAALSGDSAMHQMYAAADPHMAF